MKKQFVSFPNRLLPYSFPCVWRSAALLLGLLVIGAGCQTLQLEAPPISAPPPAPSPAAILMPGDDIEINVFGTPELNTMQKVRPDGKIAVKLFGEMLVAGKEPMEVQKELVALYDKQIQVKAITVITRSAAAIYVTGAVVRPSKVEYLRPMTVLEAIMECGGFDARAGSRRNQVRVLRREATQVRSYLLDLDEILTHGETDPFFLKPYDVIYIPGAW